MSKNVTVAEPLPILEKDLPAFTLFFRCRVSRNCWGARRVTGVSQ